MLIRKELYKEKGSFSGQEGWALFECSIAPGEHVFMWSYRKDISQSDGDDAAWIDDIRIYNAFE